MPKPKPKEPKRDFINRCVSELIEVEGREPDQARAICESLWKDGKKSILVQVLERSSQKIGDEANPKGINYGK